MTIMQQIDCNPQFGSGLFAPVRKKVFIFSRVSRSDARAEILFAAPNCDARCLFAPRESGPARLQPWLRSLGCDRQRQSPPHLADRRAHARTPRFIDNGSARGLAGGDAFRSAVADQRASLLALLRP